MKLGASIDIPQPFVDEFRSKSIQRIERAAMVATDKAARGALGKMREEMQSQRLGTLGNALGTFSDLKKGFVFRRGPEAFNASAGIYLRNRSERTVGALISYTEGADIAPVKGRWLWIATDDIQRIAGSGKNRRRVTPAVWKSHGLEARIGKLIPIRGINGWPLLAVENVGVALSGAKRSVKGLTKSGRPRKGQLARKLVIAFYAIPRTSRARRVDLIDIASRWAAIVPDLISEQLRKG